VLILERPWTRQPQGPIGIDWGNPITNGLAALTGFGAGPIDVATSKILTPYGSISRNAGSIGIGAKYSAADSAYERVADDISPQEITLFCVNTVLGTPSANGCFVALSSSGNSGVAPYVTAALKASTSSNSVVFGMSIGGAYGFIDTGSGLSTTVGATEFIVGRIRSGAQNVSYYANNVLSGTAVSFVGGALAYSSGRRFIVGEDYRFGRNGNRITYIAGLWTRYLSDAELVALRVNPWQLFAPQQIIIPTPAAAGYTHPTLSAATAIEIGATSFKPRVTYTFA
jgi:hypothetical protein